MSGIREMNEWRREMLSLHRVLSLPLANLCSNALCSIQSTDEELRESPAPSTASGPEKTFSKSFLK